MRLISGTDFSTLFELLPIGAYRSSLDGRQLRANPALVRLNGYASEAQMLAAVRDIGPEWYVDDAQRQRFLDLMDRDGRVQDFRSEIYRHNTRERIWVREHAHVVRDSDGSVLYFEGTVEDITEAHHARLTLRETHAQLAQERDLLETTLDSISQGFFMIGVDGRVNTFNRRVCELLDFPESMLRQRPTIAQMTRFQLARGDFGPNLERIDLHTHEYVTAVAAGTAAPIPALYLRTNRSGRSLEVKTQTLSSGQMVRTFTDVTDYLQAQRSLERLNQLLEATQSMAHIGGWEVDLRNNQVFWTDAVYRILETSAQEYTPTEETSRQFFTPESAQRIQAAAAESSGSGERYQLELEMVTAKGRRIWVHLTSALAREHGVAVKRTAVIQDISERKLALARLRESEEIWKLALGSTGDGVWDWDLTSGVEVFSKRCAEMYGYTEEEMSTRASDFDLQTHPDDLAQVLRDRQAHFNGRAPSYVNEHRLRCKDGSWKWILARGMVISRDAHGRPLRMVGTHTDITERKNAETLIWQQANFDILTGLPNRRMLRDRLEQEIRKIDRDGLQLAILFVDLDDFKQVNDTLGHGAGDHLLIMAARRIEACVRESDTVARMGGDEFTLVLSELHQDHRLDRVLQNVLDTMSQPFQIGDEQVFVSASIGITIYPTDGTEVETLFKNADQALYAAKGAGRNRFSFFTPELQDATQSRARLASDLRLALAGQQFRLVYQPIVSLRDGSVRKAEALLRWQHPNRGEISPSEFIPIAEATGLIIDIGEWVFAQAAQQTVRWRSLHHPDFQTSINKSPVQFHNDAGRQQAWIEHLVAIGLGGAAMVVEITEGLLLDTSASVTEQLLQLRDAGVKVSLDDFGTGYSSLAYLQRFDIDTIKIDQSFICDLVPGSKQLALCKAMIVMAHELGMQVIAEGVETVEQRDLLTAAGCDFGQGYLFARPMPADAFDRFMAERDNAP